MDENKKYTILIVENEFSGIQYLQAIIHKLSIDFLLARNGEKAVELFSSHKEINLILMDIKMPIMNGYDTTREIRALEVSVGKISLSDRIPIIAVTGCAMSEDKLQAFEAGCDDYLSKPFSPQELKDKIEKYLILQ